MGKCMCYNNKVEILVDDSGDIYFYGNLDDVKELYYNHKLLQEELNKAWNEVLESEEEIITITLKPKRRDTNFERFLSEAEMKAKSKGERKGKRKLFFSLLADDFPGYAQYKLVMFEYAQEMLDRGKMRKFEELCDEKHQRRKERALKKKAKKEAGIVGGDKSNDNK